MNIQTLDHKNSIDSGFIERILIDIACIESGFLKENFADKKKKFFEFSELKRGIPLTIPFIPQILDSADFFQLSVEDFSKIIFGENSLNYIGTKLCYKTNIFVKNYKIKSDYKEKIKSFINEIYETKFKISELKEKFNYLGAFQTRNIPHLGHEKIIEIMLEACDAVVINPIIGPKKPGDVNSQKLKYIYENILKPRFDNRIFFIPIRANMFYAGPREAIHHCYMREWLGFTKFSIGRDHAGSDNFYDPSAAKQALIQNQDNFKLKILTHNGAYFCKKCKKILLKGSCLHDKDNFEEISGSELRNYLKNRKIYKFASADVANWAMKNFKFLF
tara:strand:- start:2863 stop:3858 length:996 start_codon:yes stop_codon:yes gene_type:complete